MLCCNQLISVTIPAGSSAAQMSSLIGSVVSECATILPFCGQGPPNPPPTVQIYQNSPQTCSFNCPDGTTFVFTVPAGVFGVAAVGSVGAVAAQNAANQQAQALACQQAKLRLICLSQIPPCACLGTPYSSTITETGGVGPFQFALVSGALPPGLALNPNTGTISGVPSGQGQYAFTIRCTSTMDSSYNQKSYGMTVLTITTSTLPAFTAGVPYSFQLVAAGGSGFYNWAIGSGTLPDGLLMSLTGLISGTPTGGVGVQPMSFVVIDTLCEAAGAAFFPPSLTMSTKSTTQIATVRGFPEYPGFVSTPPKRYHTLTWNGTSEHQLWYLANSPGNAGPAYQVAGALIIYGGASTIDSSGNYTSLYTKNLYEMCAASDGLHNSFWSEPVIAISFLGWIGPTGHTKCPPPGTPYAFQDNVAVGKGDLAIMDSSLLWGSGPASTQTLYPVTLFTPVSSTQAVCTDNGGNNSTPSNPSLFEPVPFNTVTPPLDGPHEGVSWFFASPIWINNYSATLSNEYTDAEALANAKVIVGTGTVAQNSPRTFGFVSTFTSVVFTLAMTNLINGTNYAVSVDFLDTVNGVSIVKTTKTYPITGDATGAASIVDIIPTPAAGHYIFLRNPQIHFA